MLNEQLIIKALALTDKTMEDMMDLSEFYATWYDTQRVEYTFSIEKFAYYLQSRRFILAYYNSIRPLHTPDPATIELYAWEFWYSIMELQDWNEKPLEDLLSKIK